MPKVVYECGMFIDSALHYGGSHGMAKSGGGGDAWEEIVGV